MILAYYKITTLIMLGAFGLFLILSISSWGILDSKVLFEAFIQLFIPLIRWTVFLFLLIYFKNSIIIIIKAFKGDDNSGN